MLMKEDRSTIFKCFSEAEHWHGGKTKQLQDAEGETNMQIVFNLSPQQYKFKSCIF